MTRYFDDAKVGFLKEHLGDDRTETILADIARTLCGVGRVEADEIVHEIAVLKKDKRRENPATKYVEQLGDL